MYKVTYPIYYTDTKPTIKYFDEAWEAEEWVSEEIDRRVSYIVEHSQYAITEDELYSLYNTEDELVRIEKVQNKNEIGA
jgi:hypothetical protein